MTTPVVKLVRQVKATDLSSVRSMVFPRKEQVHVGATFINEGVLDEGGEYVVVQITTTKAKPSGGYRIHKVDQCTTTSDVVYLERIGTPDNENDARTPVRRRMRFAQLRYSSIWWLKP